MTVLFNFVAMPKIIKNNAKLTIELVWAELTQSQDMRRVIANLNSFVDSPLILEIR